MILDEVEVPSQHMTVAPLMDSRPPRIPPSRRDLALDEYVQGVLSGDRALLGRAITLVESLKPAHQAMAQELLARIMPRTGKSIRVGVTGFPGAGKSTLIEALGCNLTAQGHRVAVLAIDPSSQVTGGSILGDKTRMERLSAQPGAFIRPSPSSGTLGGVARKTRETMLLCEASGYDVVLVETVGIGQSETVVSQMVDFFLVMTIAGAGDELQGIKRGVLELADMIVVNKADGDNVGPVEMAAQQYRMALQFMRPHNPDWQTPVLTCSAHANLRLDKLWETIEEHGRKMQALGKFEPARRRQLIGWMWSTVDDRLAMALRSHPRVQALVKDVEQAVLDASLTPTLAARRILEAFGQAGLDGMD
jgi:LAO/AO transport system kinase